MTTADAIYGDYTREGLEMLGKLMRQGYEEVYFKEAAKLLDQQPGEYITKTVLGEQQYQLHLQHGWEVVAMESRSYGQMFTKKTLKIKRSVLLEEVTKHVGEPIV